MPSTDPGPRRSGPRGSGPSDPGTPVPTSAGTARVDLDAPAGPPVGVLALGHGAGGGVDARDLRAVRDAAVRAGWVVARVTQPYRLAGRRPPAPAAQLDAAWTEVLAVVRATGGLGDVPLVTGGRSSGSRVACRTAVATGAAGVVALAFPLHPPGRPDRSRALELHGAGVPVLVLQGERDPFGSPAEVLATGPPSAVHVHAVPGGDHGFAVPRGGTPAVPGVVATVLDWLAGLPGLPGRTAGPAGTPPVTDRPSRFE